MKERASERPGHMPVVVLVTDGSPTECDPQNITDLAQIAKTAFDNPPKVRTVVVGIDLAVGGANLNQLAAAGGTKKPFFINGGDIGAQFVDAMLAIPTTIEPVECRFDLPTPEGQMLDISQVTVTVITVKGDVAVPRLDTRADCARNMDEGWLYDPPTNPAQMVLCPGTCAQVAVGALRASFGCK
jgi:hypothetical protein